MKKKHVEEIRQFSQKTDEVSYGIFSAHNCRRLCEINTISMHACSACGPIGYPRCQRTVLAVAWPFSCYFYNLFHLFRYSLGLDLAASKSSTIQLTSAELPRKANLGCLCLLCDAVESPRWKVLQRYEKMWFLLKCCGVWGGLEDCAWLCQPGEYKVASHMVSF